MFRNQRTNQEEQKARSHHVWRMRSLNENYVRDLGGQPQTKKQRMKKEREMKRIEIRDKKQTREE